MMTLLQLTPEYHPRVWGGPTLDPAATQPIGEAWIVYEHNRIAAGSYAGRTLDEVTRELGAALLGEKVFEQTGARFPLLIKLLDCHDWLSVQVHPNDEQARALEGPQHFGKTEAWHILTAQANARLISGIRPGTTRPALADAIRSGTILDWVQYHPVSAGDTIFMPAGTLHALGPGLLLYEVQQTSDITYRVFDWNRPASAGRALHIEQSVTVTDPEAVARPEPLPTLGGDDAHTLVHCPYFTLEMLTLEKKPCLLNTSGESFHALTVTVGEVAIICGNERVTLKSYESVIVPAEAGTYTIEPLDATRVLKASV